MSFGFLRKPGIVLLNVLMWAYFFVTSTVLFVLAVVIRILTAPFDPSRCVLHKFSCFWASLYLWGNPYWSLRKKGLKGFDRKRSYVIVSNHQSWVDILILFNSFIHFKWISKKQMFNVPLLGWNMRLNGYIPIDRGNEESGRRCLEMSRGWLAKGSSVLYFPEGTRSRDGKLLPFKMGAFKLAVESGHDVLPIVIRGSLNALPKDSVLLHRKSRMSLEVLPPISVKSFQGNESGAESLMNHVRTVFKTKLLQ